MNKVSRIGLLGLGVMGKNHLRVLTLLKGVEIAFIYDQNQLVTEELARIYKVQGITNVADYHGELDAIIIATPTISHENYISYYASKVKYLFVEKPLTSTHEEALRVLDLTKNRNLNIQVGFIERFNPAVLAVKEIVDSTNSVIFIDFTRTNKISSRIADVDVVTDLMIHDIDLAYFLNGPISDVKAHGVCCENTIDHAFVTLMHSNGRYSRILASRITEKRMRRIQVTCHNKFIDCDLLRKEIKVHRQSEVYEIENQPYVITAVEDTVEVKPREALLSELMAFVNSLQTDTTVTPSIKSGVDSLDICDQIRRQILTS